MQNNNHNRESNSNANFTDRQFYSKPTYTQQHIGGAPSTLNYNTNNYISNQKRILQSNDQYLLPNLRQDPRNDTKLYKMRPDSDRYDPIESYNFNKGLKDDGSNIRRFQRFYLNIDSRNRPLIPSAITDQSYQLKLNPIKFILDSKIITFTIPNNPFKVGDLIQITRVAGPNGTNRTFDESGNPTIDIPKKCNFMKVYFRHGVPLDYIENFIQVDINGIKGDIGSVDTASYLGNVPINVLNTRHSIIIDILNTPNVSIPADCIAELGLAYFEPSPDYFFISIPIVMQDKTPPYILSDYNYFVNVLATNGVPLNLINSVYPITLENLEGYKVITAVDSNNFSIEILQPALSTGMGGGSNIIITSIVSLNRAYQNPNSYIFDLGKTYHNIVTARLIASEFPNSSNSITSNNNKLYWNDIDDGDYIYSISVPPGNYTPSELAPVLQDLFFNVQRINANNQNFTYESTHFIKTTINSNTNQVLFESYKQYCVVQPIINIDPPISPTFSPDNATAEANSVYTLTIYNPGHNMINPGQVILIQGAISTLGIPADAINTLQTVSKIIDANTYEIILPKCSFNLSQTRIDTKGGAAVNIFIPSQFRLRFDQPDTLGSVLGFRNPGSPNSVYAFATTISNSDPYQFELDINAFGNQTAITNNSIDLSGEDYILMKASPLETFTFGNIGPLFAKIQLCDIPGKVLFNSFVQETKYFEDPLNELSTLDIAFYTADGNLYDFNGLNHSFTIELVTVNDIPDGTGISPNTGKNYNIKV